MEKKHMWKILVVDDDFLNRKLITSILKNKAECDMAANGFEAIEAYNMSVRSNEYYDAILLDIAMPDMDGMEVLRKIRENEKKAGINIGEGVPVIMVTAYPNPVVEAFDKGCDDYIVKPIVADALINKLHEKIEK